MYMHSYIICIHIHIYLHKCIYTYTHVSIPLVEYLIGGNGLSLGRFMGSRDGKYLLQRRKPRMGDSFPVNLC